MDDRGVDSGGIVCGVGRPMISPETWTLRAQILRQLGGRCVCPCGCADPNLRRLELHHPLGDGNKHRMNLRGVNLYKYLSKQLSSGQPIDPPLVLLCLNCHGELTRFGSCNGVLIMPIEDATGGCVQNGERGQIHAGSPSEPGPFVHRYPETWAKLEQEIPPEVPRPPEKLSWIRKRLKGKS